MFLHNEQSFRSYICVPATIRLIVRTSNDFHCRTTIIKLSNVVKYSDFANCLAAFLRISRAGNTEVFQTPRDNSTATSMESTVRYRTFPSAARMKPPCAQVSLEVTPEINASCLLAYTGCIYLTSNGCPCRMLAHGHWSRKPSSSCWDSTSYSFLLQSFGCLRHQIVKATSKVCMILYALHLVDYLRPIIRHTSCQESNVFYNTTSLIHPRIAEVSLSVSTLHTLQREANFIGQNVSTFGHY